MPLIKDFNKYLLGVEMSDKHHRNLIDIVNDLYDSLLKGAKKEIIAHYLKRIRVYTLAHFQAEELFMLEIGYPDLINHKIIHKEFVDKVGEFILKNETSPIGKELVTYLVTWLMKHILETDKKYVDFMNENKKD